LASIRRRTTARRTGQREFTFLHCRRGVLQRGQDIHPVQVRKSARCTRRHARPGERRHRRGAGTADASRSRARHSSRGRALRGPLGTGLGHTARLVARRSRACRGGSPHVHSPGPAGGPRRTRTRPAGRRVAQPAGGSSRIPPSACLGRGPQEDPHCRAQYRSPPA